METPSGPSRKRARSLERTDVLAEATPPLTVRRALTGVRAPLVGQALFTPRSARQDSGCLLQLIRHGETKTMAVNYAEVFADDPLSENGKAQAARLQGAVAPVPELVLVSPLTRAIETALLAFPIDQHPALRLVVEPSLREFNSSQRRDADLFARHRGRPFATLQREFPDRRIEWPAGMSEDWWEPHGGFDDCVARVAEYAAGPLFALAGQHKCIALVAHEFMFRVLSGIWVLEPATTMPCCIRRPLSAPAQALVVPAAPHFALGSASVTKPVADTPSAAAAPSSPKLSQGMWHSFHAQTLPSPLPDPEAGSSDFLVRATPRKQQCIIVPGFYDASSEAHEQRVHCALSLLLELKYPSDGGAPPSQLVLLWIGPAVAYEPFRRSVGCFSRQIHALDESDTKLFRSDLRLPQFSSERDKDSGEFALHVADFAALAAQNLDVLGGEWEISVVAEDATLSITMSALHKSLFGLGRLVPVPVPSNDDL